MKNFNLLVAMAMVCLVQTAYSQDKFDVIRYSSDNYQSDARSMGAGNAFGALGGNLVSMSINPAGLAMFPTSVIQFSGGISNTYSLSEYLTTRTQDQRYGINLNNFGYVSTKMNTNFNIQKQDGWLSSHFALTMNRTNSFRENFVMNGNNRDNSMLDRFNQEAQYLYENNLEINNSSYGGMAYNAYLIDPLVNTGNDTFGFTPAIRNRENQEINQRQAIVRSGQVNEFGFTYAANYEDKLYLGASVGIPFLHFHENGTYNEINNDKSDNFQSMRLNREINDFGVGVNLGLGMIIKPNPFVRLGFSIKSPTFYSINRTSRTTLQGITVDGGTRKIEPNADDFNYRLNTPLKATMSAAFIIKKKGFLSIDYNFQNMGLATIGGTGSSGKINHFDENQDIQNELKAVHTLRVGGEMLVDQFALRAGYAMSTSAIRSNYLPVDNLYGAQTFSLGFGMRNTKNYWDIGIQNQQKQQFFQPYSLTNQDVQGAIINLSNTTVLATIGFLF